MNAVDATGKGGEIRLVGRDEAGWVEVAVEDDGRGIEPADRARVFQPYFTTKPRGTGLGLFVCRQIVEERGGRIGFESELGLGTTVTVRLPAQAPEPAMAAAAVAGGVSS
jgi:signal transduction histidine kinase